MTLRDGLSLSNFEAGGILAYCPNPAKVPLQSLGTLLSGYFPVLDVPLTHSAPDAAFVGRAVRFRDSIGINSSVREDYLVPADGPS